MGPIREIARNFGDPNDTQFEAELLNLLEREAPPEDLDLGGLERIVLDLAKKYRRQTLLEASYKEKIVEESDRLAIRKKDLGDVYSALANEYLDRVVDNQKGVNRFLEVHTVFTYFVFNKEVFPQISLSKLAKKGAARKILRFLERKKETAPYMQALESLKEGTLHGTIQEVLNAQSQKLFEQFKDYRSAGVRALTPEEISRIATVSRGIEERPEDVGKFAKLEKILEKILLEDEAFVKNCEDLAGDLSLHKAIKLQTHMNACLLFTEGYSATDATGLRRSVGFKKLNDALLKAMEGESIELRALRNGERILDQLESFEYPPEVLKSFQENIETVYRNLPPDRMRDLELGIAPIDIEKFPHIKQKKVLLEELKGKILELTPRGESEFLAEKSARQHGKQKRPTHFSRYTTPIVETAIPSMKRLEDLKGGSLVSASDAIKTLFSERGSYTRKFLEKEFKDTFFSHEELVQALRSFVGRENVDLNIFSPNRAKQLIGGIFSNELDLAILIAIHEDIHQEYNDQLSNLERLHITEVMSKRSAASSSNRASVFDNTTLFRYYKKQTENFSQNYRVAEQLYDQFLPLFLTSYLADAGNLNYGRDFFVQARLDSIKQVLPGIDRVFGELEAYLLSKGRELAKLENFFKEQENQPGFLEEDFLNRLKQFIRENLMDPLGGLGDMAMMATIVGLGILLYTGSPILCVIGGLAISYFWETGIKPFIKDVFYLAKEAINYLFGNGYTPESINDYILDLFKVAISTEVKLSQGQNQGEGALEIQHLFSNSLFLQEEFSIMRNSRYSLLEFRNRLHMLLPNTIQNANFSTMILNLFFKFNEPIFLNAPPDLLKNAQHPQFTDSLGSYLLAYNQMINREKRRFLDQGHSEEECSLELGAISPFKDYLTQEAEAGHLKLSFYRGSSVHEFLGAQSLNLDNFVRVPIEGSQIVPTLLTTSGAAHMGAFIRAVNEGLAMQDQFLGAIRPVLLRSKALITPHPSHTRTFQQGLKTSYFLIRYALDTARRLDHVAALGDISGLSDMWLSTTNETGQSIFLSPLYREVLSMLMRTAELAASTGMEEGQSALRVLTYLQQTVDNYMRQGTLPIVPLARFQELETAIRGLIDKVEEEPHIVFPILMESQRNQSILLPFTVWSFGQSAIAEEIGQNEAALVLRNANNSNVIYLSNQALELFFTSAQSRGFALSPMVMNVLENALKHQNDMGLLDFLGIMNERDQARLRSMASPERFTPDVESLRRNIASNLSRQRGQPLALMPPQEAGVSQGIQQPVNAQPQVQPVENAPQQMMEPAPQEQMNAQPQMMPGAPLPSGQGAQGQVAQEQIPVAQEGQPSTSNQMQPPQREQQQAPSQNMMYMPMMMPGMQGQPPQASPVEGAEQQVMREEVPQEQASEPQGRNVVMVGADGRSGTYSVGGSGGANQPPPQDEVGGAYQRLADRGERYNQMPREEVPPIGPAPERPYRGPMNMEDFQQYQEDINQPQPFPYGKAAAIGGGLMLGAALLSQLMKKDEKKRKKP